jgi:hypothetical protein
MAQWLSHPHLYVLSDPGSNAAWLCCTLHGFALQIPRPHLMWDFPALGLSFKED